MPYLNEHTIKMVYSAILNLIIAMMFHAKILTASKEKMLVNPPPPPTIKYDTFIFEHDLPKYHCIQIVFKEVSIGKAPEQIVFQL